MINHVRSKEELNISFLEGAKIWFPWSKNIQVMVRWSLFFNIKYREFWPFPSYLYSHLGNGGGEEAQADSQEDQIAVHIRLRHGQEAVDHLHLQHHRGKQHRLARLGQEFPSGKLQKFRHTNNILKTNRKS